MEDRLLVSIVRNVSLWDVDILYGFLLANPALLLLGICSDLIFELVESACIKIFHRLVTLDTLDTSAVVCRYT